MNCIPMPHDLHDLHAYRQMKSEQADSNFDRSKKQLRDATARLALPGADKRDKVLAEMAAETFTLCALYAAIACNSLERNR